MTAPAGDLLDARVRALVALYRDIATTRMRGLPLLNSALQVEAVGFELVSAMAAGPAGAQAVAAPEQTATVGILITPWFMNLVWLPLQRLEAAAHVGSKVTRHVGRECFEFIGAHENGFGDYEACSLFSPMFEFQSQRSAVDTAHAVLDALRQLETATVPTPAVAPAQSPDIPQAPARRAFLFGRSAAADQAARPAVQPHEINGRG